MRSQGVILGQLGTLAMREGKLDEALTRHRAALALFQQLREPAMEAVAWHQLGMVFKEAQQWDEAERHYRESARIEEEMTATSPAPRRTWNQLAIVSEAAGKPEAAEGWYRKAIEADRAHQGDQLTPVASPEQPRRPPANPTGSAGRGPATGRGSAGHHARPSIPARRKSGRPTTFSRRSRTRRPLSRRTAAGRRNSKRRRGTTAVSLAKPNATSPARGRSCRSTSRSSSRP